LTTVFVDYDNIYLSLKKKNDEAAKRFAKDSALWLEGIVSGQLITPTSGFIPQGERRLVMNRCYGNPVPRRNSNDNSTDMNSFPFIRHHFLKSGFEVIDCPPLTAQLKNSADIRIVMDVRDILTHDTFFDEFIIMSGDADFTPVLHRLRAHARRTVVFANDSTAQPYTAISDGEIRESSLMQLLLKGQTAPQITSTQAESNAREIAPPVRAPIDIDGARRAILGEVVNAVRSAPQAVPLETLADRAVRMVGHERTIGTQWGGYGSFRELLLAGLPDDIHLSDTPPYTVFDANRHISQTGLIAPQLPPPAAERVTERPAMERQMMERPAPELQMPIERPLAAERPMAERPIAERTARDRAPVERPYDRPVYDRIEMPEAPLVRQPAPAPQQEQRIERPAAAYAAPQMPAQRRAPAPEQLPPLSSRPVDPAFSRPAASAPMAPAASAPPAPVARQTAPAPQQQTAAPQPTASQQRNAEQATQIQQSIARIHEACQAPALAPAEYRVLFDVMANELTNNGLQGAQTLSNITQRAREFGLDIKRDDLRFILEVVSESDPWFEQGASANLFAGRFRNFVVARCRSQGLNLSADELDLVDAWFSSQPQQQARAPQARPSPAPQAAPVAQAPAAERWWSLEEGRQHIAEQRSQGSYGTQEQEDEFPRIVRSRLRG